MEPNPLSILLVDDDRTFSSMLLSVFQADHIYFQTSATMEGASQMLSEQHFDLVLLDLNLPDRTGLDTVSYLVKRWPALPIIVLSGVEDQAMITRALQIGAQDYLFKSHLQRQGRSFREFLFRAIDHSIERKRSQMNLVSERNLLEQRVAERTAEIAAVNERLRQELEYRKRIEENLNQNQANLRSLIDALPDLVLQLDAEGTIVNLTSTPILSQFGFDRWAVQGRHFSDFPFPGLIATAAPYYQALLETGQTQLFETEVEQEGRRYHLEFRLIGMKNRECLVLVRDMTERAVMERMRRQYEFIVNTSKELLTLIDRNYRYQAVNDAFCQSNGLPRERILGRTVADIWGKTAFQDIKNRLDVAFSGRPYLFESWTTSKGAGRRHMEVNCYPYFNPDGEVTHVVVVSRDTTDRKMVEERLQRYYRQLDLLHALDQAGLEVRPVEEIARLGLEVFRQLMPVDSAGVFLRDAESGQLAWIARQGELEIDWQSEHFQPEDLFRRGEMKAGHLVHYSNLKRCGQLPPYLEALRRAGIRFSWVLPLQVEGEWIGGICLAARGARQFQPGEQEVAQEMSQHMALMIRNSQLYERIRAANQRLSYLASRLVSAGEDERRQIALELHDDLGQALTGLSLSLSILQREWHTRGEGGLQRLEEIAQVTRGLMDRARNLAHELHPPALEAVGLNQALQDYCERAGRHAELQINYSGQEIPNIPPHIQITLYRVLQEALTNIIKHARARNAEVSLYPHDGWVWLVVQDDGQGFPQAVHGRAPTTGLGLLGIQERLEALGGRLYIHSEPGQGAVLTMQLPVKEGL